jgi:multidrug resistance efflux pump
MTVNRLGALLCVLWSASVAFSESPATAPASSPAAAKLSGYVAPLQAYELTVNPQEYGGDLRITSIAATGTKVSKGDLLLELSPDDARRALEAAANELKLAQSALSKAQADVELGARSAELERRIAKQAVSDAETALAWWDKVDGPQMLENAELAVRRSRHYVEDQDDELEQLRKMYKSEELTNATADIVVKRAVRALELAKIGLAMEEQRQEKTKATTYEQSRRGLVDALDRARESLAKLEAEQAHAAVQRETSLVSARAAAEQAERKVDRLKSDLEALRVTAPQDGVVFHGHFDGGGWTGNDPRKLRVGEKIAKGTVVLTVVDPSNSALRFDLKPEHLATVKAGLALSAQSESLPGVVMRGVVPEWLPVAEMTRDGVIYPLTVRIEGAPEKLLPGMVVEARHDASTAGPK